ncbi:MAG: hypothetical protein QW328_07100 [Nitrososphaerota archaeon]
MSRARSPKVAVEEKLRRMGYRIVAREEAPEDIRASGSPDVIAERKRGMASRRSGTVRPAGELFFNRQENDTGYERLDRKERRALRELKSWNASKVHVTAWNDVLKKSSGIV